MKIIYRISDGGNPKLKPNYVTKKGCFLHFIKIFKDYDIFVIADNISLKTYEFLSSNISPDKIIQTSLGNAKSFIFCNEFALKMFKENEKVYFAEDDYIYVKHAPKIIEEGLDIAEYSSGYDHPDKYINHNEGGPNPFIFHGGEETRVLITKNSHWKFTNSCCMTFATTIKTIREDIEIYKKYCDVHPLDFQMFTELIHQKKRRLVSCIPGVSTHGETQWLGKFIDWETEINSSLE
jgi:hypothetical protein